MPQPGADVTVATSRSHRPVSCPKQSVHTPRVPCACVETFVIRMWLPDRPGALGQVASRIGAVRGDVVGIDILERDGGQAVDELVVELPDGGLGRPAGQRGAPGRRGGGRGGAAGRRRAPRPPARRPRGRGPAGGRRRHRGLLAAVVVPRPAGGRRPLGGRRRHRRAGRRRAGRRRGRTQRRLARGLPGGQPGRRRRRTAGGPVECSDVIWAPHGHVGTGPRARARGHALPVPGAAPGGGPRPGGRHAAARAARARSRAGHPSGLGAG